MSLPCQNQEMHRSLFRDQYSDCNRMVPTQIRQITGHQEIVDVVISDRVVTQFIHTAHAHIN